MMGDYFGALGAREGMVSEFDTSLGIRLDYEACLAYLALPPLGPILLLMLERKSDYVRCVLGLMCLLGNRGFANELGFQVPCVAVKSALHGNVCHPPTLLVVEIPGLGVVHR
jgi:hypothetical protein